MQSSIDYTKRVYKISFQENGHPNHKYFRGKADFGEWIEYNEKCGLMETHIRITKAEWVELTSEGDKVIREDTWRLLEVVYYIGQDRYIDYFKSKDDYERFREFYKPVMVDSEEWVYDTGEFPLIDVKIPELIFLANLNRGIGDARDVLKVIYVDPNIPCIDLNIRHVGLFKSEEDFKEWLTYFEYKPNVLYITWIDKSEAVYIIYRSNGPKISENELFTDSNEVWVDDAAYMMEDLKSRHGIVKIINTLSNFRLIIRQTSKELHGYSEYEDEDEYNNQMNEWMHNLHDKMMKKKGYASTEEEQANLKCDHEAMMESIVHPEDIDENKVVELKFNKDVFEATLIDENNGGNKADK